MHFVLLDRVYRNTNHAKSTQRIMATKQNKTQFIQRHIHNYNRRFIFKQIRQDVIVYLFYFLLSLSILAPPFIHLMFYDDDQGLRVASEYICKGIGYGTFCFGCGFGAFHGAIVWFYRCLYYWTFCHDLLSVHFLDVQLFFVIILCIIWFNVFLDQITPVSCC